MRRNIFIGFDTREGLAFAVAVHSMQRRMPPDKQIPIYGIVLDHVRGKGLYTRPTQRRLGKLYDVISEHPMSTEFAVSRFLVPALVRDYNFGFAKRGWALFTDCDVLARCDVNRLFDLAEQSSDYAVMCVKHRHTPTSTTKMDDQVQALYARKNWSSVMLFNCDHPANDALTLECVNTLPGRDLHRFCWLKDEQIGELPQNWNYLVGYTETAVPPCLVHFTEGMPTVRGYENCEYADEWFAEMQDWACRLTPP